MVIRSYVNGIAMMGRVWLIWQAVLPGSWPCQVEVGRDLDWGIRSPIDDRYYLLLIRTVPANMPISWDLMGLR